MSRTKRGGQKQYSFDDHPEHRGELKPWADRWIKTIMSTEPMSDDDRRRAKEAVLGLYAAAKLPPPKHVVFVPSPFVLRFASGFAAWIWYLHHRADAPHDAAADAIGPATSAATSAATRTATRTAVLAATRAAVFDAATRDATAVAIDTASRVATHDATIAATEAATRAAIADVTLAATNDATRAATDDAVIDAIDAATLNATTDAVLDATAGATDVATHDATYDTTSAATLAATRDVFDATHNATRNATRDATNDAIRDATTDATTDATRAATHNATYGAILAATYDATRAATRDATIAATYDVTHDARLDDDWYVCDRGALVALAAKFGGRPALQCAMNAGQMWNGGNQWGQSVAYLSFFRHIVKLDIDYSKFEHYETLAEISGPRIMHADFCMISDRPEVLKVDEQNRPHCDDGPFCRWRDGSALYAIHGVRVPWWLVEHPERLTASRIEREQNAEVRRVMIERYGLARYVKDAKFEVLDEDRDQYGRPRRLLRKSLPDDEPITVIELTNSTPEPDGTHKVYHLRVHPELRPLLGSGLGEPQKLTCQNAVASTFGLRGEDYRPEHET